jgi:hypothetical protein
MFIATTISPTSIPQVSHVGKPLFFKGIENAAEASETCFYACKPLTHTHTHPPNMHHRQKSSSVFSTLENNVMLLPYALCVVLERTFVPLLLSPCLLSLPYLISSASFHPHSPCLLLLGGGEGGPCHSS